MERQKICQKQPTSYITISQIQLYILLKTWIYRSVMLYMFKIHDFMYDIISGLMLVSTSKSHQCRPLDRWKIICSFLCSLINLVMANDDSLCCCDIHYDYLTRPWFQPSVCVMTQANSLLIDNQLIPIQMMMLLNSKMLYFIIVFLYFQICTSYM